MTQASCARYIGGTAPEHKTLPIGSKCKRRFKNMTPARVLGVALHTQVVGRGVEYDQPYGAAEPLRVRAALCGGERLTGASAVWPPSST